MQQYIPNLKNKYRSEVVPALMKKFEYKTIMQVPKIEKIIIIGVRFASGVFQIPLENWQFIPLFFSKIPI